MTFGESSGSGVSFPNFMTLARAYGLNYVKLDMQNFGPVLQEVLDTPGPVLCEVILDPDQGFEPRQSSRQLSDGRIVSAPLEDMFPFLDRPDLLENLLIPPWED